MDVNCATPAPPFTNWATAATTIQDAVDATSRDDLILVTNGVYASGGQPLGRVVVSKNVTLQSVNGPDYTTILGCKAPGGGNGQGAIRCVYLLSGVLSGFTLANGATENAGNDYAVCGGGVFGTTSLTVTNCVLKGNSASSRGGGAYNTILLNCILMDNSAGYDAAGATQNGPGLGGGAYGGALENCQLIRNRAIGGGGAQDSFLFNCVLTGNSASQGGGGACGGRLGNCTLTGNSATEGGGAADATLNNCIVYFNTSTRGDANGDANYFSSTLNHCCTTPMPTNGMANFEADPKLASTSHLSEGSPCRGAGDVSYILNPDIDIDGELWANPPSVGCDEYYPGARTGAMTVQLTASGTNASVGVAVDFSAIIDGRTTASVWDFGDNQVLSNRPYASHNWTQTGDYPVRLVAYNESHPEGVSAGLTVHVTKGPVLYVAQGSTNPAPPYASWDTAANDIQTAVDSATVLGAVVLVSDGVYAQGGRAVDGAMTNRVAVDKLLIVRSLNGPAVTAIQGCQVPGSVNGNSAIRCAYLGPGAVLSGFTLCNGATRTQGDVRREKNGGGVYCASATATVSNCVLTGNAAWFEGGGQYGGTLINSLLYTNWALAGGGASCATLNNCTLALNSGGGAASCNLNNSIVYYNSAGNYGSGTYSAHSPSRLDHCCTTPLPPSGADNFVNDPLFVDVAGNDFHLQSNSPCINAGRNANAPGGTDLDGNPRIVGGTVDVGAYEFQTPASLLSYAWLQSFGLPVDGSADIIDSDVDGLNNLQEWLAGTDPTNPASALRLTIVAVSPSQVTLTWPSTTNRNYVLQRATCSGSSPSFIGLSCSLPGGPLTTSFTDTNAPVASPVLYRVAAQAP